jgi:hypothetical protein
LYCIITLNQQNNKYELTKEKVDNDLKVDFTKGKTYNVNKVNDWFNKIPNPSLSNTERKNNIINMLSLFKFSYAKHLSHMSSLSTKWIK